MELPKELIQRFANVYGLSYEEAEVKLIKSKMSTNRIFSGD